MQSAYPYALTLTLVGALASCNDTGQPLPQDVVAADVSVEDTGAGVDVDGGDPSDIAGDGLSEDVDASDIAVDVDASDADAGPDAPLDADVSEDGTPEDADAPDVGDIAPDVSPPGCGDGVVVEGEECDDGNREDGDNCTNACEWARCGDGVLGQRAADVVAFAPRVTSPLGVEGSVCDVGSTCPGTTCVVEDVPEAPEHGICQALGYRSAIRVRWGGSDGVSDAPLPQAAHWSCDDFLCSAGADEPGASCGAGRLLVSLVCDGWEPEACDDGENGLAPNQCREGCELPVCGDGVVDDAFGEECDDGNAAAGDGCTMCLLPQCGDGVRQSGEVCDDGNDDQTDSCRNDCTLPECGDGFVQPGEECDDGAANADFADACRTACVLPTCGDGITDSDEECDDANAVASDGCNSCSLPQCGDGVRQAGEACDDGNESNEDLCRNDCQIAACGDGFVQPGEACDDGPANADLPDACRSTCRAPQCRDGIIDTGEDCDDGNSVNDDGCSNACLLPQCGDGVLQVGEECDDGNDGNTDECSNACTVGVCGDGIVQDGAGALVRTIDFSDGVPADFVQDPDAPWFTAENPRGEGIVLRSPVSTAVRTSTVSFDTNTQRAVTVSFAFQVSTEACCDGLRLIVDGAIEETWQGDFETTVFETTLTPGPHTVSFEFFRDFSGFAGEDAVWLEALQIQEQARVEECDDGNEVDTDLCTTICENAACGDGVVQPGESCDDGNDVDNDACTNACTPPACGDGVQQSGEECDDGNADNTDFCRDDCLLASCGDGIVQAIGPSVNITFDFDGGAVPGAFATDWTAVAEGPDGSGAIRAATIGANSESLLSWSVDLPAAAMLSFDRRVESESCCDSLELRIDGAIVETWQGIVAWDTVSYELRAGPHEIVWRYEKDGSVNTGADTAWIDNLSLVSADVRLEECDDGAANAEAPNACRTTCVLPACLDGVLDAGEQCDDGNMVEDDGCSNICRLPACGDGVIQLGEECDDGNDDNTDGCSNVCEPARCGDGILNTWSAPVAEVLDFETGLVPAELVGDWGAVTADNGSEFALASADIGNSQQSGVVWAIDVGEMASISFDRRVSSEQNFDSLRFFVDDVEIERWSGTVAWANQRYELDADVRSLEWRYVKDNSQSTGEDAAFIDNLTLAYDREVIETCDDGNLVDGDGCSAQCEIEEL